MSIELVMPSNHLILCCPFILLPYIFPSNRVFSKESALHISWPKYWSFSFSIVLPMNIQDWPPLGWTGWISLQSKGLSGVFSNTTVQKHQFFDAQPCLCFNSPTYTWLLEKTIALVRWTFVGKVMSLLFNTLSRFVIAFLPRKKTLNFMAAVTICSEMWPQKAGQRKADLLHLKMKETGHKPTMEATSRSMKKGNGFSLNASRWVSLPFTPWFWPKENCQTFNLQNLKIINVCCLGHYVLNILVACYEH